MIEDCGRRVNARLNSRASSSESSTRRILEVSSITHRDFEPSRPRTPCVTTASERFRSPERRVSVPPRRAYQELAEAKEIVLSLDPCWFSCEKVQENYLHRLRLWMRLVMPAPTGNGTKERTR